MISFLWPKIYSQVIIFVLLGTLTNNSKISEIFVNGPGTIPDLSRRLESNGPLRLNRMSDIWSRIFKCIKNLGSVNN